MTTAIASFARIVNLDSPEPGHRPENKHLVAWNDEQREAAARAAVSVKPWTPIAPKPEPEAVVRRRSDAAKLAQQAAEATAAASAADEEATQLKHLIATAEGDVSRMELRLSRLQAQDFNRQANEARAMVKAQLENCDTAAQAQAFATATLTILRAPEFEKIRVEAIAETETALAAARARLAELTGEK